MSQQITDTVYNTITKAIRSAEPGHKVEMCVLWFDRDENEEVIEVDRTDSFPKTWAAYAWVHAGKDVNHEELGKRFEDDGFKVSYLDHVRFGRVISEIVRPRAKN